MAYQINPNAKNVWLRDNADTQDISPMTDGNSVYMHDGKTLQEEFNINMESITNTAQTIMQQEEQITNLEKILIQGIVSMDYANTLTKITLEMNEVK